MKTKSVKKVSDEDRIRKRKSKSRKPKHHYSSDSDSSLTHKKKKKPKKTKESKKRNPRKKSRHVSSSTSGYSTDSSCSTCEKQNPKKKRKVRKNSLSRERKGSGLKYKGRDRDRERGRSVKRSRSCSTSSSSSISKSPSPRKEKREKVERETVPKDDKFISSYDDFPSSSKYNDKREKVEKDSSREREEREEREPSFEMREKDEIEKTQNEKEKVADTELVLRQKALENFIKFQKFKIYSNNTNGDERENLGSNEPSKETERVETNSYERYEPVLNEPITEEIYEDLNEKEEIISDYYVKKPRIKSVISIPIEAENNEANTIIENYDNKNEGSDLNFEESFDLSEPNPNPNSDSKPNPSTSEGEFQEKTFSRMKDGEMVQVSYKVYIPKKASATARRKLIR